MAILNYVSSFIGETDVSPRLARLICNDSYATVITPGYLGLTSLQGNPLSPSDFIFVSYGAESNTQGIFTPSISNGVVTLNPYIGQGNVLLPVVANHIAVFENTSGQIGDNAATAINGGNIQAGLSGTAGFLSSFPATASKGSLHLTAVANTGNTVTTISNVAMGQASTISIPDPGGATANFLIRPAALVNGNLISANGVAGLAADSGIAASNVQLKTQVLAGTVAASAVAATFNITVTGVTASSIVVCNFQSQANPATILTVTAGTNLVTIVADANPGNCVISYVAYIVGQ